MKYYFPIHLNGGNRGCEAIAKGSAELLGLPKENLIGLCSNVALDTRLGGDKYITLTAAYRLTFVRKIIRKIISLFDIQKANDYGYAFVYNSFLDQIQSNDIMLSTGGDMMCYMDNEVIYTNDYLHKKGVKTVLWGCSFGENNITSQKVNTLKRFSMIYARETLTEQVFRNLGLTNVCCYPDPAFVLKPEKCALPKCFDKGNVIGLNLSNFVLGSTQEYDTPFGIDVIKLVEHILNTTQAYILLIPHVLWEMQDDRIASRKLYEMFASLNRISILDSDSMNYCQIRYVISKLSVFIGARTHAVISGYSTYVPTIALGYSIKSKGIAHDLGLSEQTVVDTTNYFDGSLLQAYEYIQTNYSEIKHHMEEFLPSYVDKTWGVKEFLQQNCKHSN